MAQFEIDDARELDAVAALTKRFQEYAVDPVRFVTEFVGVPKGTMWSKQVEILEAIRDNKYVAVPSGHNLGKSWSAGVVAWWWKLCFRPSKVIVTAPGSRQSGLQVGNEIRGRYDGFRRRFDEASMNALGLSQAPTSDGWREDAENFMVWFSTRPDAAADHATRMAGFHSPNLMFLFDEAGGIDKVIWEAIQGSLSGKNRKLVAFGNPSDPTAQFARFCRSSGTHVIRLDATEFPNVVEDRAVLPYGPTRAWIKEMGDYWGEKSGAFQWKVRGLFPTSAIDTLMGYEEVSTALARDPIACAHDADHIGIGCDVARFGDDRTTVYTVCRCGALIRVEERHGQDLMATVGMLVQSAGAAGLTFKNGRQIGVDDTGLGAGVTDRMKELGWRVRADNFGSKPVREINEAKFANRRSELWWWMRDFIRATARFGTADQRVKDVLLDELTTPKYTPKSDGRIMLEPKADVKTRIGRSPDHGDALALAIWGTIAQMVMRDTGPDKPKETDDDREDREDDEKRNLPRHMRERAVIDQLWGGDRRRLPW